MSGYIDREAVLNLLYKELMKEQELKHKVFIAAIADRIKQMPAVRDCGAERKEPKA